MTDDTKDRGNQRGGRTDQLACRHDVFRTIVRDDHYHEQVCMLCGVHSYTRVCSHADVRANVP